MSKKIAVVKKQDAVTTNLQTAVNTTVVVASLKKKAQNALKKLKGVTKVTKANVLEVSANLKNLKIVQKEVEATKQRVLAGIKSTEKEIRNLFKPAEDLYAGQEEYYKGLLEEYENQKDEKVKQLNESFGKGKVVSINAYTKKMEKINTEGEHTVAHVDKLEIIDKRKIPLEYLDVNESAIRKALKAGTKVPGVELKKVKQVRI